MEFLELMLWINVIRRNRSHVTNAFFTGDQIHSFLDKGGKVLNCDDLLLLLEDEASLTRLFFHAARLEDLRKIRSMIPIRPKPIVTDIVGKRPQGEILAKLLQDEGFELYSTFVRMTSSAPVIPTSSKRWVVQYAVETDIDELVQLLYMEFDPLIAHIPPADDILLAVKRNEITLVRVQGLLAGFAFFERTAIRNACLRYFVVHPEYRNRGIGSALLAHTFAYYGGGTNYMLWVGTYNSALHMYERLNFRFDGMTDYIMKLEGSRDEQPL